MSIRLDKLLEAIGAKLGDTLTESIINTRALRVLGDDVRVEEIRVDGETVEFKALIDGALFVCQQNKDGEVVAYRLGPRGLIFEGLISTARDGRIRKSGNLCNEYYDSDGRLVRREYPDGIVEHYDGEGNLVGRSDPLANSAVERTGQRSKRRTWKKKLNAQPPRRLVPKSLGPLEEIAVAPKKDEPIIVVKDDTASDASVTAAKPIAVEVPAAPAKSVSFDAPAAMAAGAIETALFELGSAAVPAAVAGAIYSSRDNRGSAVRSAKSPSPYREIPVSAAVESGLLLVASPQITSTGAVVEREDDRHVDTEGGVRGHRIHDDTVARVSAALNRDASLNGAVRDVSVDRAPVFSEAPLGMRAAIVVFEPRRGSDESVPAPKVVGIPLFACMTFDGGSPYDDNRERLAEAPRYPSIPINAPLIPMHKFEMKQPRIVADPSDPEQADYEQPDDDGQSGRQQDEQDQEETEEQFV